MKRLAILFCAFCLHMTGVAQSGPLVAEPEVLPQYPEGTTGLYSFINDQMRYSDEDRTAGIEGEMIVTFIVRQDGRLSDVEIKKGLSPGINSEIRTVIGKMPDWRPGRSGGQWVSARYSLAMKIDAATGTARPLF